MPIGMKCLIGFTVFLSLFSMIGGAWLVNKPREPLGIKSYLLNLVFFTAVIIVCAYLWFNG